jgi:histidine triad (HIT) family protein
MPDDCLFCKIVAGEIPADKVYEDDEIVAFRDIRPAAPTHVLVIPKAHIPTLNDLTAEHDALMGRIVRVAQEIARDEGLSDGYRLVVNCLAGGGQVVFHLHAHLIGGRSLTWPPG